MYAVVLSGDSNDEGSNGDAVKVMVKVVILRCKANGEGCDIER